MRKPAEQLNERQYRFVHEYLKDFDGAAAYKRAGYKATGNSAEANASRLLRQAKVRETLARVREEIAERTLVDKEFVMKSLRENLARALQRVPVMDKEGNPTGEWVYNGTVANKALELLGKELGMFGDKLEVSGGREPIKQLTVVRTIREDEAPPAQAPPPPPSPGNLPRVARQPAQVDEQPPEPEQQRAIIPASESEAEPEPVREDPIAAMQRRYLEKVAEDEREGKRSSGAPGVGVRRG